MKTLIVIFSACIVSVFALKHDECLMLCASGVCCEHDDDRSLCCPVTNGVCCSKTSTCCSEGSKCNSDGSCSKINIGFWSLFNHFGHGTTLQVQTETHKTTPIMKIQDINKFGKACKHSSATCSLKSGSTGCCPFTNGVCCEDKEHCCPSGYSCDASTKSCRQMFPSFGEDFPSADDRLCSLEDSNCPDKSTCCKIFDGSQGCCPIVNADCCTDGFHCCPEGTRCNADSSGCDVIGPKINPFLPPWSFHGMSSPNRPRSKISEIICPDMTSSCPDETTCCKMNGGDYGCCQANNAVCCADGNHCCPHGYSCNNEEGTCFSEFGLHRSIIAMASPNMVASTSTQPAVVKTNTCDKDYICPDSSTCCKMGDGQWGCCPLEKATCCEDHIHCCPHGYTCQGSLCSKDFGGKLSLLPRSKKQPAVKRLKSFCPDDETMCVGDTTCCILLNGLYGCCPMPDAVCCNDRIHCCPKDYTCDLKHNDCISTNRGSNSPRLAWSSKLPGLARNQAIDQKAISCPNDKFECPVDSTCCPSQREGEFACCPKKNAVCCPGGSACCEDGYSCESDGKCLLQKDVRKRSSSMALPWDLV